MSDPKKTIEAHLELIAEDPLRRIYGVPDALTVGHRDFAPELELHADGRMILTCLSVIYEPAPERNDEILLSARQVLAEALGGRPVTLGWTEPDDETDLAFTVELGEAVDPDQLELPFNSQVAA